MSSAIYTPLALCVYILAFLTGVPSNLLACYTFLVKLYQKPSPVGLFLLNLTISDLLFLFVLPFKMVEAASGMTWSMASFFCPIVSWVYFSTIHMSILFLTAVSIMRYLGVAYPMKYKVIRKMVYAVWICGFIWGFSALHGCIPLFFITVLPRNESHPAECYESLSEGMKKRLLPFRLEESLLVFFIPLMVTIFCYFNFVRLLLSMPNIERKKKYRAICLAVVTIFNFTLCFAPNSVSNVIGVITNQTPQWRVYALLLPTLNASIDPIIFYYSSTAVQKTFLKCLQGMKKKLCIQEDHEVHMDLHISDNMQQ